MLHKIKFLLAILVVIALSTACTSRFSGCSKEETKKDDAKEQKTENKQKDPNSTGEFVPEKDGVSGQSVDPKDDEIYQNGSLPTGVYDNGQLGFNFNVAKKDLKKKIEGVWGATEDGTYFCMKGNIDAGNIPGNPMPIKIGGYMTHDPKINKWRFKPVEVTNVDNVDYYTYKSPNGPVAIDDNVVFCFAYWGSKFFYPHEGVKKNVFTPVAGYTL